MTAFPRIDGNRCGCDEVSQPGTLISIDAALAKIERLARGVSEFETVALSQSLGRVLAVSVRAAGMVPAYDNAAMDGYAVHTQDLQIDAQTELPVVGRIAAGHAPPTRLERRTAMQIFTGAPVPEGANAVVMQELVSRQGDRIRLNSNVLPGDHIRRTGEDMLKGKIIVPAGRSLSARDIAACAAAGHERVKVARRVRVALLVTGDEVTPQGQVTGAASTWDVNTPMLRAAISAPGIDLCHVQIARDCQHHVQSQLQEIAKTSDLIVTTGGISVGDEDHVKPALSALSAQIAFSGVAMKPGKPVSFGRLGNAYWLGLPGNPLSAFVTWHLFGTVLCDCLAGRSPERLGRRHVILQRALHHKPGRCELRLGRLSGFVGSGLEVVDFPEASHSGRVSLFGEMDGLLFIPADADVLPKGSLVEFQPF